MCNRSTSHSICLCHTKTLHGWYTRMMGYFFSRNTEYLSLLLSVLHKKQLNTNLTNSKLHLSQTVNKRAKVSLWGWRGCSETSTPSETSENKLLLLVFFSVPAGKWLDDISYMCLFNGLSVERWGHSSLTGTYFNFSAESLKLAEFKLIPEAILVHFRKISEHNLL